MNKILVVFSFFVFSAIGQVNISNPFFVAGTLKPAAGGGGGADVTENFEGTGYENTWVEASGTPAEDTATTGLSLEADQCLYIDGETGQEETYVAFTASDNLYMYFLFRFEDVNTATRRQWSLKSGTTTVCEMANASGPSTWTVYDTVSGVAGGVASADTTYHCWFEREKGTGMNEKIRFYVSTTSTKPGTPDCEKTNGTGTGQVDRFYAGTWGAGGGNYYFDKVRISRTTAFGSNPP